MLPAQHWAYNFSIGAEDIENITNLLLEKETPLSSEQLATAIIDERETEIKQRLEKQYRGTVVYRPADSYQIGDRLIFSSLDYATASVISIREGRSSNQEPMTIAAVQFDEENKQVQDKLREFVINYPAEHPLNDHKLNQHPSELEAKYTLEDIINAPDINIVEQINQALEQNPDLVRIAGTWFVRELMVEVDEGHLNLAEAVLDINQGGPLPTEEILQVIGSLSDVPEPLQIFSLNYAMNEDKRFDEVGPAGKVLWHLTDSLPRLATEVPPILQYEKIEFDRKLLTQEMLQLEYDLDDEHSPISSPKPQQDVCVTLIYPHYRIGTLPINSETKYIFPGAKTPRIAITMIDTIDKQEYPCWVVHEFKYVCGLLPIYRKHLLTVGAYVYLTPTEDPSRFEIEFDNCAERTEWFPVVEKTENKRLRLQLDKRSIRADYDEMLIIGVNNVSEVDELGKDMLASKVGLSELLRGLVGELSKENPQDTVPAKVLYSALNLLRRCPPGPMLATLLANPEFEHVGGGYWKLSD